DRAHDDDVVLGVAHDLELELVPPEQRLLHEHLADRALAQRAVEQVLEVSGAPRRTTAVAAEGERRAEDDREAEAARDRVVLPHDPRRRHLKAGGTHRRAEALAILGAPDRLEPRADQLDPELLEHAGLGELQREVERRLTA